MSPGSGGAAGSLCHFSYVEEDLRMFIDVEKEPVEEGLKMPNT